MALRPPITVSSCWRQLGQAVAPKLKGSDWIVLFETIQDSFQYLCRHSLENRSQQCSTAVSSRQQQLNDHL